jgi:hypothetical protein
MASQYVEQYTDEIYIPGYNKTVSRTFLRIVYIIVIIILILVGVVSRHMYDENVEEHLTAHLMDAGDVIIYEPVYGYPGNYQIIPVLVTNCVMTSSGEEICQVDQNYSFNVEVISPNCPVQWELYKDKYCQGEPVATEGFLKAGVEEEYQYYLKVTWQNVDKHSKLVGYTGEIGNVKITVASKEV